MARSLLRSCGNDRDHPVRIGDGPESDGELAATRFLEEALNFTGSAAVPPRKLIPPSDTVREPNLSPVLVSDSSRSVAIPPIRSAPAGHLIDVLRSALCPVPPAPKPPERPAFSAGRIYIGRSPLMREVQSMVRRVAVSQFPVLIQGETGTGKEVIARELHALSGRAATPMLKLNCAALPSELVESELFGYERGAFTGAFQRKLGLFEIADGGCILLDEIGDMEVRLQAKLLQVLQDGEFQRLGGRDSLRSDVRVMTATHRDLEAAIAQGVFREDLYYRINVIKIRVPPLRECQEDILPLAEHLLRLHAPADAPLPQLPPGLKEHFLAYNWPGNIRELENVVRNYLALGDADAIRCALPIAPPPRKPNSACRPTPCAVNGPESRTAPLPDSPQEAADGESILQKVAEAKLNADRKVILAALRSANWNRKQAARELKVPYKALLYRMKKCSVRQEGQ